MAGTKDKEKQKSGWVPPFFSGIVVGTILVSCVYYFGVRNFDPDTEFLKTFPDVENTFPNISFEFPMRLQETNPDRVGADTAPAPPSIEESIPTEPSTEMDVSVDESVNALEPDTNSIAEAQETISGYVLQAGAFAEKKHADSFRASLLIEGYNAFTKQTSDVESDVQYRVIVGPYDTVEESRSDSDRLKARNISTFIVPMREVSQ